MITDSSVLHQLWILAFSQLLWSWPAESAAIDGPKLQIFKQELDGSYFFLYESPDGSYREEVGIVKDPQLKELDGNLEVSGVYRYVDNQSGQKVEVSYSADGDNGFLSRVKYNVEAS
ncbi:hypothetical protein KR074_012093 [Drosophila pseudoananassae]|nr:hypothetical protein KR074_012093 [Drosophila pseudoananassae]